MISVWLNPCTHRYNGNKPNGPNTGGSISGRTTAMRHSSAVRLPQRNERHPIVPMMMMISGGGINVVGTFAVTTIVTHQPVMLHQQQRHLLLRQHYRNSNNNNDNNNNNNLRRYHRHPHWRCIFARTTDDTHLWPRIGPNRWLPFQSRRRELLPPITKMALLPNHHQHHHHCLRTCFVSLSRRIFVWPINPNWPLYRYWKSTMTSPSVVGTFCPCIKHPIAKIWYCTAQNVNRTKPTWCWTGYCNACFGVLAVIPWWYRRCNMPCGRPWPRSPVRHGHRYYDASGRMRPWGSYHPCSIRIPQPPPPTTRTQHTTRMRMTSHRLWLPIEVVVVRMPTRYGDTNEIVWIYSTKLTRTRIVHYGAVNVSFMIAICMYSTKSHRSRYKPCWQKPRNEDTIPMMTW